MTQWSGLRGKENEGAHGKVHFIISSSWSQSESAPVSEAGWVLSLEEGPGVSCKQRQPGPVELCCLHPLRLLTPVLVRQVTF